MLSIVIVNWNTRDPLRKCLSSIAQFPPDRPYEVIVVDNASSDGSALLVAQEFPSVKLCAESQNWGYAKGNNIGFSVATGDLVLTLNPDTEFTDDTLSRACRYLDSVAQTPTIPKLTLSGARDLAPSLSVGIVAPRLIGPDGKTQQSVRGFPTIVSLIGTLTGLDKLFPLSPLGSYRLPKFDYALEQLAPQPMGTFLLFRRSDLARVVDSRCPFDEAFPIFFNEVDLLKRLHDHRIVCAYVPSLTVRHLHGASTSQRQKSMIWESHRSLVRYFGKHTRGMQRLLLPFLAVITYSAAFVRARGYYRGFRTNN